MTDMNTVKTGSWQGRPGRKLRVAFVDDQFRNYVDLPEAAGVQKRYEDRLRAATGGRVSLYRPGSPYRDDMTPPLDGSNLEVFEPDRGEGAGNACPPAPPRLQVPTGASNPAPAMTSTSALVPMPTARVARAVTACPPVPSSLLFPTWWSALAAVPAAPAERDWWAGADTRRAGRYERLKRVWFDTTRNHWFYGIGQEDHLTATLWENFCLFHPADSVPALSAAAGLGLIEGVSDACWGYEFEEHVGGRLKQTDVTLHYRNVEGDGLIVVEAKRPGGPLKPTDRDPRYYLDLPSFAFAPRRRAIYLVDDADLPAVRAAVGEAGPRPGFLTWQALGTLQVALTGRLPVSPRLIELVGHLIRWQFGRHGFQLDGPMGDYPAADAPWPDLLAANRAWLGLSAPPTADPANEASTLAAAAMRIDAPPHVAAFVAGALQHQACCCGVTLSRPVHDYLAHEPARTQIVAGMPGRQRTADRRRQLWRLPSPW
jgi:hypothetical protein